MSEVVTGVTGLIEQVTDVPADRIEAGARFDSLANWTSYAALRLLTGIEEHFGVRMDLQRYFAIKDVGGLIAEVTETMGRRS